jgi:hypothetical protein
MARITACSCGVAWTARLAAFLAAAYAGATASGNIGGARRFGVVEGEAQADALVEIGLGQRAVGADRQVQLAEVLV